MVQKTVENLDIKARSRIIPKWEEKRNKWENSVPYLIYFITIYAISLYSNIPIFQIPPVFKYKNELGTGVLKIFIFNIL